MKLISSSVILLKTPTISNKTSSSSLINHDLFDSDYVSLLDDVLMTELQQGTDIFHAKAEENTDVRLE